MKKPPFVEDEIYHIYNRGVEKRSIFKNDSDRFRFIHDLFEFNDKEPALNIYYKLPSLKSYGDESYEVEPRKIRPRRELLVEIVAFCLMPNHFHLLLRQRGKNGIINFMQKLGTGYTMYFNKKHDRVGPLFQGRFKAIHVNSDDYFRYLCHYIHLNPLDMFAPEWREEKIKNKRSAMTYLENYRWSSSQDYSGIKNFPSVISKDLISDVFENKYKNSLENWINNLDLDPIKDLLLE